MGKYMLFTLFCFLFSEIPLSLLIQGCFKEGDISELPDYNAPQVSFIAQTLSIPEEVISGNLTLALT